MRPRALSLALVLFIFAAWCVSGTDASTGITLAGAGIGAAPDPPDTSPPTPDPATMASAVVVSDTSITWTATTGTDATGPVEYLFTQVTGEGSRSQGWGASAVFTPTDLTAETLYGVTVQMRDSVGTPNVGTVSSESQATTDAAPSGDAPVDGDFDTVLTVDGTETAASLQSRIEAVTPGDTILVRSLTAGSGTVTVASYASGLTSSRDDLTFYDLTVQGLWNLTGDNVTLWGLTGDPFALDSTPGSNFTVRDSTMSGGAGASIASGCTGNVYVSFGIWSPNSYKTGLQNMRLTDNSFVNYTNCEDGESCDTVYSGFKTCANGDFGHTETLYLGATQGAVISGNHFDKWGTTAAVFLTSWECGYNAGGGIAIGSLPGSPALHDNYEVSDGANSTDCTTGGGSDEHECYWDGDSWEPTTQASPPCAHKNLCMENNTFGSGENTPTIKEREDSGFYLYDHGDVTIDPAQSGVTSYVSAGWQGTCPP